MFFKENITNYRLKFTVLIMLRAPAFDACGGDSDKSESSGRTFPFVFFHLNPRIFNTMNPFVVKHINLNEIIIFFLKRVSQVEYINGRYSAY